MRPWPAVVSLLSILIVALIACGGGESETAPAVTEEASAPDFVPIQGTGDNGQLTPSEEVQVLSQTVKADVPREIRLFAVQQLVNMGTPDTVAPLTFAMADPDEEVAIMAIQGVPETDAAETRAQLEKLAEEKSGRVQREAIKRLGEFRKQQS